MNHDIDAVRDQVAGYLTTTLRQPVAPDEDIFASGLVDSLFALELVTFVERTFGFEVRSEDLELDNFRSASAIATLVVARSEHVGEGA